jgi:hypothetical protein
VAHEEMEIHVKQGWSLVYAGLKPFGENNRKR